MMKIRYILINTLVFFYIYDISFSILPNVFTTKAILAIFGFSIFILKLFQHQIKFKINSILFKIGVAIVLLITLSLMTMFYNMATDLEFIKYSYKVIGTLFAAYFIIQIMKKFKYSLTFTGISNLIINVVLIQALITSVMFFSPEIKSFLYSIQNINVEFMSNFKRRFMGFGSYFFGAGIINGMALILIAILFRQNNLNSKEVFVFSLKFMIILIIGMMLSRTTMAGFMIAIIIIIFPKSFSAIIYEYKKRLLFFAFFIFIPITISLIMILSFPFLIEIIEPTLNFAFEMFLNYSDNGTFSTRSSDGMIKMYKFPIELKTWIIGDGLWADPNRIGKYYMGTDIGYLRLIYYFGTIGLLVYLMLQYYIIVPALKMYRINYSFIILIYGYLLILNLKGAAQLTIIGGLYLIAALELKKQQTR